MPLVLTMTLISRRSALAVRNGDESDPPAVKDNGGTQQKSTRRPTSRFSYSSSAFPVRPRVTHPECSGYNYLPVRPLVAETRGSLCLGKPSSRIYIALQQLTCNLELKKMTESSESRTIQAASGIPEQKHVTFTGLFQQGIERIADFNKLALDLYAHHTADVLNSWRRFFPAAPVSGMFMLEAAGQGIESFVRMQKSMLDVLVKQSTAGIRAMQPPATSAAPVDTAADSAGDAADVLISEEQEDARIAARVVDRIAELVQNSDAADQEDAACSKSGHHSCGRGSARSRATGRILPRHETEECRGGRRSGSKRKPVVNPRGVRPSPLLTYFYPYHNGYHYILIPVSVWF